VLLAVSSPLSHLLDAAGSFEQKCRLWVSKYKFKGRTQKIPNPESASTLHISVIVYILSNRRKLAYSSIVVNLQRQLEWRMRPHWLTSANTATYSAFYYVDHGASGTGMDQSIPTKIPDQ
jgi:hypothetical protein